MIRAFRADATQRQLAPQTRMPTDLLSHLGDLMVLAEGLARGERVWAPAAISSAAAPAR